MKLVMSSFLLAFASSALVAEAPAQADPSPAKAEAVSPERLNLARRFVGLSMSPDVYMEQVRVGFMASTSSQFDELETNERIQAQNRLGKIYGKIEPGVRAGLPKLFEAYSKAYAREYSADELQQMIAFADTPAGRHFLTHSDFVEADAAVQDAAMDMWRATLPVMQEFRKEMCAEKAAQRVAMGDTKAKCPLAGAAETQAG